MSTPPPNLQQKLASYVEGSTPFKAGHDALAAILASSAFQSAALSDPSLLDAVATLGHDYQGLESTGFTVDSGTYDPDNPPPASIAEPIVIMA